ncbi:MAG: NAD(P)/FAD-dependent oxidoreductase [Rhodobacter sp.]|uniref:NAD(P)/FAD-dependent oxidoreductase n=1 Tax=Pararhodobacter sp. TaxID=2127056 RepID=UPI002D101C5F|nr:NAD(P)/FAD-dependent oxidoreductase [Pararhodobacter sp.]MCC0074117.1 NAD(P)/FAD-dependent oxidoreductase [Rhodobacter sp.]HPD92355.1 NAD(P)/FAD-dependent oxidoreductase [Pararhodobacter sp.]
MDWDVIVLGAGAAGLMAAIEAARRGRRVLVLDHARAAGEKIRISGGGRCNFTNRDIAPERFLSANPRFALSALRRFTQNDFIARVNRAGIAWHEKTLGQLFCDGSARQIVDLLLRDLAEAGGVLRLGVRVDRVHPGFTVETGQGRLKAASVVVATGGKSIPRMGASGFGYQVAQDFGLPLVEPRPGLVPLTFTDGQLDAMRPLAGVTVQARVGLDGAKIAFDEGLLFTHRGLSGPSILQISSYWREGQAIRVDLARGRDIAAEAAQARDARGRQDLANALDLPEKLARAVVERAGLSGKLAEQSRAGLQRLGDALHRWRLVPAGTEGWRTAEVTLGGVDTAALDARTMQARTVPGLYFVGEVVDVTGWLGGYNFQWAWSSGWAAGQDC